MLGGETAHEGFVEEMREIALILLYERSSGDGVTVTFESVALGQEPS